MKEIERAIEVLRKTEETLRSLLSDAAKSCDYNSVLQLAHWAKAVSDLTRTTARSPDTPTPSVSKKSKQKVGHSSMRPSSFPRFYRQGELVIRVARSKRGNGEYQHKASHQVLIALADAMVKLGDNGRIFSTDDLLPIEVNGEAVPAYQSYLGITLFKQVGLIDQHGRQGYSIPRFKDFKEAVNTAWKNLPRSNTKEAKDG